MAKKCIVSSQLIIGWIASFILFALTYWIESFPPKFTEFFEGDIALSYSVHDTVPYRYVLWYCYVVPVALLCLFVIICRPKDVYTWVHDIIYVALRSYVCDEVLIVLLKNFIGRPRPCFFQMCKYENTTTILNNGDKLVSFGTFGVLGNVTKCHGSQENIYNAFRSFPSGHSASAMNATIIVILLLFQFIDSRLYFSQYAIRLFKTVLSLPLIAWACFIFGSRIFDYRHRPEDVAGGMIFGFITAVIVFKHYFPSTHKPKKSEENSEDKEYRVSSFFSNKAESAIQVFSKVTKPEYALV